LRHIVEKSRTSLVTAEVYVYVYDLVIPRAKKLWNLTKLEASHSIAAK